MSDSTSSLVSAAGLAATSITAQTLGGALAVVYLAFHHIPDPQNGISPQMLEDSLTLLFSTTVSVIAMIGHVVFALLAKKYLSQT